MPALGLGTFQATVPGEVGAAVKAAIKCAPAALARLAAASRRDILAACRCCSDRHWPENTRPRVNNRAPPAQPAQSGRKPRK